MHLWRRRSFELEKDPSVPHLKHVIIWSKEKEKYLALKFVAVFCIISMVYDTSAFSPKLLETWDKLKYFQ